MVNNEPDKMDYRILNLLQRDAQLPHKAIASEVGLSPNSVNVRIKRLVAEGYIKKYVALVDHKRIGRGLIAYTQVHVKPHTEENLSAFLAEAVKLDEVMECSHLTGKFDFLLKIAVADIDEYNLLLKHKLANLPKIDQMESMFVMSQDKCETAFKLKV